MTLLTIVVLCLVIAADCGPPVREGASVLARIESGWVRGRRRAAQDGAPYASFRGVPYATQPLGELRFKELQPLDPWHGIFDASSEGPACPQHNIFFGQLMQPQGFSEACIHANVHVPWGALPEPLQPPTSGGLPIVVFFHGGGWVGGSGDADVYGPEYLVSKGVIVITFNSRLDVLGYLSLGTSLIPGNAGVRDAATLLRWVRRNARDFGGDPARVTLAGPGSGATNAHLLSLSPAAKGLFDKLWLMSGTAYPRTYISSPKYAQEIATTFLTHLGLNGTDYDTVHARLIRLPLEKIQEASRKLLTLGLTTFMPVQESPRPNVTVIIPDNPETLIAKGYGDDIPMVVGYNSNEAGTILPRLRELDILNQYKKDPSAIVPPQFLFTQPANVTREMAKRLDKRYFNGNPTMDKYLKLFTETFFVQPALRLVKERASRRSAPVFLYTFAYEARYSAVKSALNLTHNGAGHLEDMSNVLKINSFSVPANATDDNMKNWTSELFANFVKTGNPSLNNSWPPQSADQPLRYQKLAIPYMYQYLNITNEEIDLMKFHDDLAYLTR